MTRRYFGTALVLILLEGAAFAQQVKVREEVLANGMKLLMVERHDSPTIACGWVAKVGSVNETAGITGISHLFEHMLFKGTRTIGTSDNERDARILAQQDAVRAEMEAEYAVLREKLRSGEISGDIYDPANVTPRLRELRGELEKLYAAEKEVIVKDEIDQIYTREGGSDLNAFTGEDQTVYFVTLPSNKLELWFWMESDRLANPVFREFYSERDVVREERRLRIESTPTGKFQEAFDAMFWESSPYSHPVAGWPADVESITRAQAESYFGTYYAPNNITAALVGDFDPDATLNLARVYFGRLPRGKTAPPEMITTEMPQLAEKRFLAEADTNPEIVIRYHAVPLPHKDMWPFQLLARILNGRTGRLYAALVEDKQVAVGEPSAMAEARKYEGYFEARAEVREGRRAEDVEAALEAELSKLAKEPVGEHELQKVKNQELANSFRRLRYDSDLMVQLLVFDSTGTWRFINEGPTKAQAVTAGDIQRVAAEYLTKDARNVIVYARRDAGAPEPRELAGLPPQMKTMVRQQAAAIERATDRAKLEEMLTQLRTMAVSVPPELKPAVQLLITLAEKRLGSLPPSTAPVGEAPKPAPGA
ncbi:MAG TPA: pitrilysin family protein [Thermoanaerobaculaceae bacterium]|nr:pitrilysin family protein [Thermoanaerobaculaceae bacterium]